MVKSPVLFETYTRIETARVVWEHIIAAKPAKLYFYSNKALESRHEDVKRNNEIRSWVKEVNWPCELHTFFRDEQVDQYTSLLSSKKWLFENEERGIILEDDCVPSVAFFQFCDYFLDYYENQKKILCISGNNYISYKPKAEEDHILSRKGSLYGWATWRDRFESVDFNTDPSNITLSAFLKNFKGIGVHGYVQYFMYQDLRGFLKKTHCWDMIWNMTCLQTNRLYVNPVRNLVRNIGVVGEHASGNTNDIVFEKNVDFNKEYSFKGFSPQIEPNNDYDKRFYPERFPVQKLLVASLKNRIRALFGYKWYNSK